MVYSCLRQGRGVLPGRPRDLVTTELLVELLVLRTSARGRHQEPSDRADGDGNYASVGDDEARSVDGPPGPDKEQDREEHHHGAQHELQASHHQRHRIAGDAVRHIAGHRKPPCCKDRCIWFSIPLYTTNAEVSVGKKVVLWSALGTKPGPPKE